MKTRLLLTLAVIGSAAAARADVEVTMAELRKIGYLPQDKAELRPEEKLDIKRTNPFAERKKTVAAKPTEQVETEESKLRAFFDKQKVSGVMKMGEKWTVTMGRLSLEPGKVIQPIIPNQTHILRVLKVTDTELEIGWVEDAGVGPEPTIPRKIRKKINLRPEVKELIASEDNTGDTAQTYAKDDNGKVLIQRQNVLPNPADILDNIPPGSDTIPVLTEEERRELNVAGTANTPPSSPPTAPQGPSGPPDSGTATAPAPSPGPTPAAPENPEDSVQPDPDLSDPNAVPQNTPAGPPGR